MRWRTATFMAATLLNSVVAAGGTQAIGGTQPSEIQFFVYYHGAKGPILGRSGVDVSGIGTSGVARLGSTNSDGTVTLRAKDVFAPGNIALLFCDQKVPHVCSAIRVDSTFLQGFAEFSVHLPSLELVDRIRVTPK